MANLKRSEVHQPKPRLMLRQARPNLPAGNRKRVWKSHKQGRNITRDMWITTYLPLLRSASGFGRRLTPVMRQHHVAGEKAFVDYSGKRIGIVDPPTGEIREAEIFVGVLGASNLTYAEATWTQKLPDWTGAHVRMFRFFGGAPKLLVPDNLKRGVNKASVGGHLAVRIWNERFQGFSQELVI